ncbi:RidA family protein [Amycolatopsis sp. NPDC004079]|uniref:RidA family protein n=1 Tax=Amycolatopsis sp. NPDC004079 TaxID=3154549 RepID=UPI0033BB6818
MTAFLTYPGSDPELRRKFGLGGAAVIGDLVFLGGMALDLTTLTRQPEAVTIADELRICLAGILKTLEQADGTLADIVKVNCYLSDDQYRAEFREAFKEVFAPGPYPKCLTIVAGLAGDCRVEIEVVAVKPPGGRAAVNPGFFDSDQSGRSMGVAAGGLVFAEAAALDWATGDRLPEATTLAEETGICLDRLSAALAEAGCTLADLVKLNCYLVSDDDRAEFWTALNERLAPGPYPPRITQVTCLDGAARVVVDAVAAVPEARNTSA